MAIALNQALKDFSRKQLLIARLLVDRGTRYADRYEKQALVPGSLGLWRAPALGKDQAYFKVQVLRTRIVDGTKESAYFLQGILDLGKKAMVWGQTVTREAFARLGH